MGRYRIVDLLAAGGMGEVYRAVEGDAVPPRFVALKVLRSDVEGDPGFQDLFDTEGRLALTLRHENIVRTLEVGEDRGRRFIAMEYVDGLDAAELLSRHRRNLRCAPPAEVGVSIVLGALNGLDHAHQCRDSNGSALGLVHSDVSPGNLLISRDGEVKLADFGVALSALRGHSFTGTLKGKLVYMAPEQVRGQSLTQRADVYSMGVVLYELLTGRRPFATDGVEIVPDIDAGRFLEPRVLDPAISPELEHVILCAMARHPDDRYASAADMAGALRVASERASLPLATSAVAGLDPTLFDLPATRTPSPATIPAHRRARVSVRPTAAV